MAYTLLSALLLLSLPLTAFASSATVNGIDTLYGPTAGGNIVEFSGKIPSTQPSTAYQFMADGVGGSYLGATKSGQLKSWGSNWSGQLGNGTDSRPSDDYRYTVEDVDMTGALAGKTVVQAVTSFSSMVALTSDNKLYAWGGNYCGTIGDGTYIDRYLPTPVDMSGALAGKTIASIGTANDTSYAVTSDGQLFSWGCNSYNLLGSGSEDGLLKFNTPTNISATSILAGKRVVQVDGGENSAIALTDDGEVYTWGGNWFGTLGDGTTNESSVPVAVDMNGVLAGVTVVDVAVGAYNSYALSDDGRVYSWGANWSGMIGDGTTTDRHLPTAVDMNGVLADKQVVEMAVGEYTVVVLTSDGGLYGWGGNSGGAIGNGTEDEALSPVAVDTSGILAGKNITQINMQGSATVALDEDGQVYIWGGGFKLGEIADETRQSVALPTITSEFTPLNTELPDVKFDGVPATEVRFEDDSTNFKKLVAVAPSHSPGTVDIEISFAGQTPTVLAQAYTYKDITSSLDLSTVSTPQGDKVSSPLSRGVLAVSGGCRDISTPSVQLLGAKAIKSPQGVNIYGGIGFSLECATGQQAATVTLSFGNLIGDNQRITDSDLSSLRAYKSQGDKLTDMTDRVSFTLTSQDTIQASYGLVDGGDLDEDGKVNGLIIDPVYIGIESSKPAQLADTGSSLFIILIVATIITVTGMATLVISQRKLR